MSIAKIELRLQDAHGFVSQGDKSTAKQVVAELLASFAFIENHQKCLVCIDSALSDSDVLLDESSRLRRQATALYDELKSGISVYVEKFSTTSSASDNAILHELNNRLIAKEIGFAESADKADWLITITLNERERFLYIGI